MIIGWAVLLVAGTLATGELLDKRVTARGGTLIVIARVVTIVAVLFLVTLFIFAKIVPPSPVAGCG